ncbi:IS3 family transposase [Paenibacillus donghaensis]|uniref:IS3 family transposase n=1 Tax=Paenibacillus donghaensis TaxID=414771 RepID=UPI0018843A13|nr:IS3 family transposase [Paenibacillus donghaensis]
MRKYKQQGEFGLVDRQGRRKNYVDQDRNNRRSEKEIAVLNKWLEITKGEVYQRCIESYKSSGVLITPQWRVSSLILKRKDYPYNIRSMEEVQRRIKELIHFYNQKRSQRKLNKLTPVEYRRQLVS